MHELLCVLRFYSGETNLQHRVTGKMWWKKSLFWYLRRDCCMLTGVTVKTLLYRGDVIRIARHSQNYICPPCFPLTSLQHGVCSSGRILPNFGARYWNMTLTSPSRSYSCLQPQSRRAPLSSNTIGHESATQSTRNNVRQLQTTSYRAARPYASQTWNWVIGSPGQWVIWVVFHVRVTGSSFWPGVRPDPSFSGFRKKAQDKGIKTYIFLWKSVQPSLKYWHLINDLQNFTFQQRPNAKQR